MNIKRTLIVMILAMLVHEVTSPTSAFVRDPLTERGASVLEAPDAHDNAQDDIFVQASMVAILATAPTAAASWSLVSELAAMPLLPYKRNGIRVIERPPAFGLHPIV